MQRWKHQNAHLILFTRWPEMGSTKTRLIPALGAEGAAQLQRKMSETAFATLCQCRSATGATIEIRYCGGDADAMRQWLTGADAYSTQGDGDLGARLDRAFGAAFRHEKHPVIALGADCPTLSADHLATALALLASHDLVLGPATDGGYYLIGLNNPQPALFAGISWGSAAVLNETLERARTLHLNHLLLETLADVDRPEDLLHLGHHPGPQ